MTSANRPTPRWLWLLAAVAGLLVFGSSLLQIATAGASALTVIVLVLSAAVVIAGVAQFIRTRR